jgi:large subunit ribosomal protein L10
MISRIKKEKAVEELLDVIQKSKSIYFTGFSGLNVSQINEFRNNLRQIDAKAKVAKKTLADLSFKKSGMELDIKNKFEDSVMFEFALGDPIALAKTIWQFSKKNKKLKILGGWMDGKLLLAEEVVQLAQISSREVLLGRAVASLASPIRNFNYLLKGNTLKLIYTLKAIAIKQ